MMTVESFFNAPQSYRPRVGDFIKPDTWNLGGKLVESNWDEAAFRIVSNTRTSAAHFPTKSGYVEIAVNIEVTGRTVQYPHGKDGRPAVRGKLTFVREDEENVSVGAWIFPPTEHYTW